MWSQRVGATASRGTVRPVVPRRRRVGIGLRLGLEQVEKHDAGDDEPVDDRPNLTREDAQREAASDGVGILPLLNEQHHARRETEAVGDPEHGVGGEEDVERRLDHDLAAGGSQRERMGDQRRERRGRDQHRLERVAERAGEDEPVLVPDTAGNGPHLALGNLLISLPPTRIPPMRNGYSGLGPGLDREEDDHRHLAEAKGKAEHG